jgi:hypothetical protein
LPIANCQFDCTEPLKIGNRQLEIGNLSLPALGAARFQERHFFFGE